MRNWQKSSFSNPTGNCVELSETPGLVLLRNSRFPDDEPMRFTQEEMDAFLRGVKAGEFDQYILPDDLSDHTPEESLAKAEDAENRAHERVAGKNTTTVS